jgi:hypothetical protein
MSEREGYKAPVCGTCSHKEGQHRSNRASLAGTLRFGPCLVNGCKCREFVDVDREESDRDAA